VTIRAHHLLCLLGFQGFGYNPEFIRRMSETRKALEKGPEFSVKVVESCDDICSACSYFREKECRKGKLSAGRTREIDRKILKMLGLKKGQVISSSLAIPLVKEKLGIFPKLVKVCVRCGWREVCTYYLDLRADWRKENI
jgi:uncharacterized protein